MIIYLYSSIYNSHVFLYAHFLYIFSSRAARANLFKYFIIYNLEQYKALALNLHLMRIRETYP